jgi:hypothetical protein
MIYKTWLRNAKLSEKELAMAEKAAEKRNKELSWGPLFPQERTYFLYKKAGAEEQALKPNKRIIDVLGKLGYEIIDYRNGIAVKKDSGQKIGIGKVLNRANEFGLKKVFDERLKGEMKGANEDLYVCFSYRPEDIAGMSTDRNWTSCMNLRDEGENFSYQYYRQVFNKIKRGGLVAYLIKEGDKNIENPLARVSIRRYVDKKGDFIFLASDVCYGVKDKNFVEFVQNKIDESNEKTVDEWGEKYKDIEGGYPDVFPTQFSIQDFSKDEKQIVNARIIQNMLNSVLEKRNIGKTVLILKNLSENYYTDYLRKIIDFDILFKNIIEWMPIKIVFDNIFASDIFGGYFFERSNKYIKALFDKAYENGNFNDIFYLHKNYWRRGEDIDQINKTINWIVEAGSPENAYDFSRFLFNDYDERVDKLLIQYLDVNKPQYLKAMTKWFTGTTDAKKIINWVQNEDVKQYIIKWWHKFMEY